MTTLITIPGATAYHIPAPGAEPVPLAEGNISLTLVPAFPPSRPRDAVTLTVGESTFVLNKNAPVQRTNSKNEHPSFAFTPAPLADGRPIGQVRIDMRDSRNPEEWDRTEQACTALQAELKTRGLWEDKMLFVDDEYETGKIDTAPKVGWGESIASNFMWAANKLMGKDTEPSLPTSVPVSSPGVHSTLGPAPPPKAQPVAVAERPEPENFRDYASHSWKQAGIAAQGIGAAAAAVGGAIGHQVRDAVDNLGTSPTASTAPNVPAKDATPVTPAKDAPSPSTSAAPVVPKEVVQETKVEVTPKVEDVPAPKVKTAQAETEDEGKKESETVTEDKVIEVVTASVADVKLEDTAATTESKTVVTQKTTEATPEMIKETIETTEETTKPAAEIPETDTPVSEDAEEAETEDTTEAEPDAAKTTAPKKKNKKKGKKGKN